MNLIVNDKEILEKYSEIQSKIKSLIKKGFNSELMYNNKCIKTKVMYMQIQIIKYKMIK